MTTLILGGGITGLLAAWHLQRRGEAAEVWEAEEEAGGWVQTLPWPTADGRPGRFEKGPQGILVSPGSVADQLFKALDLELHSPGKGARWVGKGGRLVPVPAHPVGLVTSSLMTWSTKFRMFLEPFQPVGPEEPEEGLSDFIARRAGRGMAEELLPPMVAGILAAPSGAAERGRHPQAAAVGGPRQHVQRHPQERRQPPHGARGGHGGADQAPGGAGPPGARGLRGLRPGASARGSLEGPRTGATARKRTG